MATNLLDDTGIVLGSTDREGLVAWYRAVLEPLGARWEEHLLRLPNGSYIGFDERDDLGGRSCEPGRTLVNFGVRDIRAAEQHLNGLGVRWVRPVEKAGFGGWMSTVEDPDGNLLQFIAMPDGRA